MTTDYALFASVVETGSLSATARKLLTSPAMVSKRLARLEQRLGVTLIHRSTRKLALTGAGQRFYDDVKSILQATEEAENRVVGILNEPSGLLRVSAPTSFGRLHIAPGLHQFLERYPRVELTFDLTDERVDLYRGDVDVAVRITSTIPASVEAHRLAPNHRILCASPAYLERHGRPRTIEALRDHRLVAADGQLPWQLANGKRRRTVDGQSHVRTNSSEIVRELALRGAGIALRSLWDIDQALRRGTLVPVLEQWEAPADLWIYALHPKAARTPTAISAFIDFLRGLLEPLPWATSVHKLGRSEPSQAPSPLPLLGG